LLTALTKVIPVSYVITGTTPPQFTFNVTPSTSIVVEAPNTEPTATARVEVYANALPPYATYITASIPRTGVVASGSWASVPSGGYQSILTLNLTSPSATAPGRYSEVLTLTICYDLACARPAIGSPWTIPIRYTVTATAGTDFSERTVDVRSNDLAWSANRAHLYTITAPNSTQSPSSLLEIDALTAQVTRTLALGGNPKVLAVTEDGLFAYVGFSDLGQVQRIALDSMTLDLTIPLPADPTYGTTYAGYLLPVPGSSTSVVVSSYVSALGLTGWASRGVYIYDDAIARSQTFLVPAPTNRVMGLAWAADNSTLYAYDQNQQRLFAATASASGLALVNQIPGVVMGPAIYQHDGLLYSHGGMVTDPATGTRIAMFSDSSVVSHALIAPDSAAGRMYMYYMEELTPASRWTFGTYDLQTQAFIAGTRVSGCSLFPGGVNLNVGRLVRWGVDGLAVNCMEGIRIINGRFVVP
jgi:sugar lactone lactonase YvrE